MSWKWLWAIQVLLGLVGILTAYTYGPLNPKSVDNAYKFMIPLLILGTIPNIAGVWRMLNTEGQTKATKVKQVLLHTALIGIQLFMVVYFVFLRNEFSLSTSAVQILILSATLAFAVQAIIVDRALMRLPNTKDT